MTRPPQRDRSPAIRPPWKDKRLQSTPAHCLRANLAPLASSGGAALFYGLERQIRVFDNGYTIVYTLVTTNERPMTRPPPTGDKDMIYYREGKESGIWWRQACVVRGDGSVEGIHPVPRDLVQREGVVFVNPGGYWPLDSKSTETAATVWYDLDPQAADLWVVAGPAGHNVADLDPDELPDGFRWVTDEEWAAKPDDQVVVAVS